MKADCRGFRGFTLIELLLIIFCLIMLAAFLLPTMARNKARSSRIGCVSNLKQIGLSFRTWPLDSSDVNPPHLTTNRGGTLEYVGQNAAFMHFLVMSNELSTPKVLVCPAEMRGQRVTATTFDRTATPGFGIVPFSANSNLSYFSSVDATEQFPQVFLTGDRQSGTNSVQFRPGLHAIWTNSPLQWVNSPHGKQGNVGLADGSVQQFSNAKLLQANQWSGIPTNRLDIP